MDLNEIPRVPLLVGLLILALVAGVAGYSYMSGNSSQQAAVPAAAEQPLTDEQMKENLENPTADMNASDVDLDSESVESGTVSEQGTYVKKTSKKAVSAVAIVKPKPTAHPSKPAKPQNPTNTNPTNPTEPQNPTQPGEGDEGYYSDEPWDPLEPPAENPDGEGDYGGDDNPEEDDGGQGDLMP